jgi:glycine/D-amino acid oxidase-like deaminating enzyme
MFLMPPDQLKDSVTVKGTPGNVFLCWSHRRHGLTLGPGMGKMMSQVVRGGAPDIELSPFGVPNQDIHVFPLLIMWR